MLGAIAGRPSKDSDGSRLFGSEFIGGIVRVPVAIVEVPVVVGDLRAAYPVDRQAAIEGGRDSFGMHSGIKGGSAA